MLCYAWNVLSRTKNSPAGLEEFDNIYNLLAKLMVSDISRLIKRGFHREYVENEEPLAVIRGKINIGESLKQQTMVQKRLLCRYDEFSKNVPFNQILKTTLNLLIRSSHMDPQLKKDLIESRQHFADIEDITLSTQVFSTLKYNRNNVHYKMLINICQLIYSGLISNEEGGKIEFADFIRDEQMATLYEKFVLNFYKRHLPSQIYRTHSPKIEWGLDTQHEHIGVEFLPQMRTDIVVENKLEKLQMIIDTKFYSSALKKGNYGEIKKLSSGNLYQILTYVNNTSYSGKVSGMLLYPTTEKELDLKFKIIGKIVKVKTLNLAEDWEKISERLLNIVEAK